jgi:3-oxoadipate enol-lactonase
VTVTAPATEAAAPSGGPAQGLTIPLGRRVVLPGRGTTFIRESGDPTAAATVLLVHGWMGSAGLVWASAAPVLGEHFRVVAPDLRGHGRGIRSRRRFRLEDCADDLAALVEELDCGPVIVVGHSMGGLVSQLLWRRRPDLVAGMVLCSTTRRFLPGRRERYLFATAMLYGAGTVRYSRMARRMYMPLRMPAARLNRNRPGTIRRWVASEIRRHDLRLVLEAGNATCEFDSRRWVNDIDVPAAVIVTTEDRAIPVVAQRKLAAAIEGAEVYEIAEDHMAVSQPEYVPVLVHACRDVAARAGLQAELD